MTTPSKPQPQRLTVADLMARWDICERTVYNLRGLRHMKIGGRRLYRLEDVEAFEEASLTRRPRRESRTQRVA